MAHNPVDCRGRVELPAVSIIPPGSISARLYPVNRIDSMKQTDWRADPLVWGDGPRVLEIFLEPTCPFSARVFGKLDKVLGEAGEDRITVKNSASFTTLAYVLGSHRSLHFGCFDPRERAGRRQGVHGGRVWPSRGI